MDDQIFYDDDLMDEGFEYAEEYEQYVSALGAGRQLAAPTRRSIRELYEVCVKPTFSLERGSTGRQLVLLFGLCLLLLFTSCLRLLPRFAVPLSSVVFGSYLLFSYFGNALHLVALLCGFVTVPYVFMVWIKGPRIGWRIGALCFAMIFMMQYFLPANQFMQIRGVVMIMTMKLFSLALDLETGDIEPPDLVDFYSYAIGVSSVVFGPWISYRQHEIVIRRKSFSAIWTTLVKGLVCVLVAVACFLHSQCLLEWLIPDEYEYYTFWLIAFRDAMAFRFSHYFISFTAQASLYLSGYLAPSIDCDHEDVGSNCDGSNGVVNNDKKYHRHGLEDYFITKPWFIELPRSLVDVVVNWNIPMHVWLKKYVFTPTKDAAGYFWAILVTYAVSSLLHGFNFQISAVLLSLGFYTYAEHVLREKLARAFCACIRAKRCKVGCSHSHKRWNVLVVLVNVGFFVLALFHLTYLGMVFDSAEVQEAGYNVSHTIRKWSQLNFVSHYTALGTFIFAKVI